MAYGKRKKRSSRAKWRQQKLAVGTVQRIAKQIAKREALSHVFRKVYDPLHGTYLDVGETQALVPYIPHGQPFWSVLNPAAPGAPGAESKFYPTQAGNLYLLDNIPRHVDYLNPTTGLRVDRPDNAVMDYHWRVNDVVKSTSVVVWGIIRGSHELVLEARPAFQYNAGAYPAITTQVQSRDAECYVDVMLLLAKKGYLLGANEVAPWYALKKEHIATNNYTVVEKRTFKVKPGSEQRFKIVYTTDRLLKWADTTTGAPRYSRSMYLYIASSTDGAANAPTPKPSMFFECRNNFIDIANRA